MIQDSSGGVGPRPSVSLVVPVYNERERFGERCDELVALVARWGVGSELVFVDDGSTDGTPELIAARARDEVRVPVCLLARPHRGKGAAVRAGLKAASGDVAGFTDVDLSTPVADLDRLIEIAAERPALVIGSRAIRGAQLIERQSPLRELLGRSYNLLLRCTVVRGIHDTQCGAKFASREVWHQLLERSVEDGFAWDVEVVALAQRSDVAVVETAVRWSHDERSRVRPVRDGALLLAAVPRITWRVRVGGSTARTPATASAPPGSDAQGVFDEWQSDTLLTADREHWWFRSKARYVQQIATARGRMCPSGVPFGASGRFVDVGGGAGGVTAMLTRTFGRGVVVEGSPRLVAAARTRHGIAGLVAHGDAVGLRTGCADVGTALDVLEHLDDPMGAIRELGRVVRPGGLVVVTVPAHPWLWSRADELLGHRRRYTRAAIIRQLDDAGLEPVYVTHVFSWLVAPVWFRRRQAREPEAQLGLDQRGGTIDAVARLLTEVEIRVACRVPLPLGTSIVAVARNPGGAL